MATEKKKKKSFDEWYEETYGGDKSEDKGEDKIASEDIAPIAPPAGDFFTFSTNKNKPIQNADIAPAPNGAEELRNQQKEAKQKQQAGFLNKTNAFKDGYQFGDITKTRRATTADIILSMAEGAGGLVEGVTDWAAYGIAQAGEKIDPDAEWTKILREGAMQNTLADASAVRKLTGVDEYSLIGNRSRSVARAVGQILTQMGAAAAGAQVGIDPALVNNVIMYLSSTGGGMTQAYNEGATDEEAALYGTISGAVNVLSEMLFAGLGKAAKAFGVGKGSGIDDYVAKKLTDKIGNRILRNGLQYSVKAGAEGLEEVVAGSLEAVGKKLTYEDEKSMKELLEDEQLFEQFMTGALASGTMQGADLATSIKEGSDFVTGETKEQMAANKDAETVVKTLADERIAAEEKAGKKLTEKDKREIRKEIETAMERGELNVDDIERIVGGDEYKNYKAELDRQEQIQNEKREILKTPVNKFTVEQQERLAELRAMKADKSMVDSLKSSLDERVAKATAPGSRLSESYTQRAARGQKFEADLSKYSKEEAAIVKKAVESGYLNNTRATHELVDFVAKMCARKGISFDFLTNEKLKESGFSVNGATVNGYWDKSTKTIGLNMNSKKAFKTVIGHEMAHVLEDTDLYKDFKNTITEYAKLKGDYEGRLEQLKKIYKNKSDEDVERELVADLVGDYLFTDEAFLKRLSVENRNVFQKLWDEVKYLHRLATAGSEQAKELERIKHMFEKVFEETKVDQAVSKDAEVEHSLTRNAELMDEAIAKNNELFGIDLDTAQKQRQIIYDYMTKHAAELKLPPDVEGDTAFKNSSYDFSEENTSVCIRSMAADALCDAVAEDLGRPLTVQDTLYISQDLMNYTDAPECVYCYVATDRRAYREFLGSYHKQMTSAIEALKSGKDSKEVYTAFLDGRKDTKNMQKRFAMWQQIAKDGNVISASDLASEKNMQDAMRNPLLAAQVKDARAYAQSASWAKKRVGYTAYNGHILKWKQSRINDLNRHYGLRFYSFSDFSPAFILENMQQITDAAVRGLKGLAYTKELDFVKIFAPTGININISVFGYDQNGTVAMDGMMGADWAGAQELRNQYENVGITFVATNDAQIEWALNQDWIDVVIPYHLVRTGQAVAKHFGYTNYTAESGDTEGADWKKGDKKTIYPAEHNNDKQTYLDAIKDANLEPRFARFVDHPNYMKLVNETRRSANNTPPMRPVFNVDAAIESLKTMAQKGGYFVPIGGDYANMQEIARDIADNIRGNTQFSLSPEADQSYLDAVNRGDTETAQRMVDEAAKEWGAYVKRGRVKAFYHGTKKSFTVFDKEKLSDTLGFFFTEEKAEAQDYGEAYRFYLKIENPIDIWSDEYFMFSQIKSDAEKVKALQEAGYDGIESFSHGILWMIAFEPNQIKSADAVTYDDNGNVIPLSERFKESNNDIRYSLSQNGEDAEPIAYNESVQLTTPKADIAPLPTARKVTQTTPKKVDNLPMREDIAPVAEVGDIAPAPTTSGGKRRSFATTAVKSDTVQGQVLFKDLDQEVAHYEPITNAVTLTKADNKLSAMGYQKSVDYFNGQMNAKRVALEDIALGERLIQESIARGDTKTAGEMIQNLAILGTELGQKVQALSIIKRLTPEGQALMLEKIVKRGKTRGDSAYDGVEFTPEMREHILGVYNPDGSYDQDALNAAVEDVKQRIADKMKVSLMDKVNAWRYLSMLGNPKTHIRNVVSNVAMYGTVAVKNAIARTAETVAPIENRTRTWRRASQTVKTFADNMALEMSDVISDGGKYNEEASIKDKRKIFKVEVLDKVYEFNNDMLSKEDWWFSKIAFKNAFSEYLTANGIKTADDIKNNPKIVEKGKQYAVEQAQIATFRQASWLANKIGEIERKTVATEIAVGAVLPFKKTPINIAKTALNYSPLGFTKTLSYDIVQVKKGNMEASEFVDHLSQNFTGTGLTLLGFLLASLGVINGAGDDDKEGKYDYQLGKQAYSINIGDSTYSLSWLSPVAMPLFVGANAYEQLVEKNEWNGDVVMQTLAQTLDPLSEMSFLSSLDDVLSSYDSGVEKFANIGVSALQSYVSQFIPTLSSQVASMLDSKKRTTKAPADSGFKAVDETVNELKYKIPFLRNTLEPTTDIWGQTVEQDGNLVGRAFDTFLAPYTEKELIATEIDTELKRLYSETGDNGVIPSIPGNTFTYKKVKYEMSAEEYTEYKQIYGQTASILFERLFATKEYQNASDKEKAKMVNKVYEISKEDARAYFFESRGE